MYNTGTRYLVVHVDDTEPSVHTYCIYRESFLFIAGQYQRTAAHYHSQYQTLHGTQNLWMCKAIERKMEQNRVTLWSVRVTIVAVEMLQF